MVHPNDTELIDKFKEFYRNNYRREIGELAQQYPRQKRSLYIDWEDLHQFDPGLADDIRSKPNQLIEYAEEALRLYDLPADVSLGRAHVRVKNLPETIDIGKIRADHRGSLIAVEGIVRKATDVQAKITDTAFECQRCGTLSRIPQSGADFQEPHECQGCERKGPFRINHGQSEFVDSQTIFLEESPEHLRKKDAPDNIEVTIEDDLAGVATAGDHVTVTGTITLDQQGSQRNPSATFDASIEGLSVEVADEHSPSVSLADDETESLVQLSNDPDLYDRLVASVAPSVPGYETEKLALALQLFGGVSKIYDDGTSVRGTIHSLFVTDPGTVFERLLKSAANASPRAIEVSGSETTGPGLTAAATPTSNSQGDSPWTLEAGPLVFADGGHAVLTGIDDFGQKPMNGLETVLTQQAVSVSKATETATFPARTSIMATARPKYGRFDAYEPIAEQGDLPEDVLGAFDLVFTVFDQPDKEKDVERAEATIQANYSGEVKTNQGASSFSDHSPEEAQEIIDEVTPDIDQHRLRDYVAYARRNCYPVLTDEAKDIIRDFYISARVTAGEQDTAVPVSEQSLESLIRLAEASARARLSDHVEQADAERAIDIARYYLSDLGLAPEKAEYDAEMIDIGESDADRDLDDHLLAIIKAIEKKYDEGAPVGVVIEHAEEAGIEPSKAEYAVEQLKQKGKVYEPRTEHLRTT